MHELRGQVRRYAWGDTDFIPQLMGQCPDGEPWAELWLGAHDGAPSVVAGRDIREFIASDPERHLGASTAATFETLPFLLKILSAAEPLSLQVHPSLRQARAGFEAENMAGVPISASERSYKDPNHKPELVCALTPFIAKCGFRPLDETKDLFRVLDDAGLEPLVQQLAATGPAAAVLKNTLTWLLQLQPAASRDLISAVVDASTSAVSDRYAADFAWTERMHAHYPNDIGVVIALLLNHVELEPGQALFLGAGNLHAYLEGAAVEVMAASDNVVRCGLTAKHVNTPELLSIIDTTPMKVDIQTPTGSTFTFDTPVDDFKLTRFASNGDSGPEHVAVEPSGAQILLATKGTVQATSEEGDRTLSQGETLFLSAAEGSVRLTLTGDCEVFAASVGTTII